MTMTKFYKGHTKAKTADLHRAYDEMDRDDAIKYAVNQLGYTAAGALSWISHWSKTDPKPIKKTAKPKAPKKTATAPVREVKTAMAKKTPAKPKAASKAEVKETVAA
jgi:hypothetical protein